MKITLGRFLSAAGVIFVAILVGGLVALPTPAIKSASTPTEGIQITALAVLWVAALLVLISRRDRVMALLVGAAALIAIWLWGAKLLKALGEVANWVEKFNIVNIFSPEWALVALAAIGATVVVMFVFGAFKMST